MAGARLPALVLIHGGAHAADCWEFVVAELRRNAPQLAVLAVDLPGRANKPADLSTVSLSNWVDSVVNDVEAMGYDDVVIAAHSLGGLTATGVVSRLGRRVREVVMIAAFVPPHGSSIVDVLRGPLGVIARLAVSSGKSFPMPPLLARFAFWGGLPRPKRELAASRLYLEARAPLVTKVDLSEFPADVPRTWVLTTRDRALSLRRQRQSMAAMGGVDRVISLDTCHDAMFSKPAQLAEILLQRCGESATERSQP